MFIAFHHRVLIPLSRPLLVPLWLCCVGWNNVYAENYSARLAPLPMNFQTVKTITGFGQVQANLVGNQLNIEGSFKGLQGAATSANIHQGPLAIPGPVIFSLHIETATHGRINGSVTLSGEHIEALKAQSLYVQLHSKAAPEGNLRGWLLPVSDQNK